jgi:hypothetical protein
MDHQPIDTKTQAVPKEQVDREWSDKGRKQSISMQAVSMQQEWDRKSLDDWDEMTDFERTEAQLDMSGKNLLAAAAPRSLLNLCLQEMDRELLQRQRLHGESLLLLSTVSNSPMLKSSDLRIKFARAERMDPFKAVSRLNAYLSYAFVLFGQDALLRPVRLGDFNPIDEKAFHTGWIQLLLTRDEAERRIIVVNDLSHVDVPIQNQVSEGLLTELR